MNKSLWKAAVLGGIVVFIWGMVSWMLLPWHMSTTHRFTNEKEVAAVIKANAPESGVYFMPSCHMDGKKKGSDEEMKARMEEAKMQMKAGPIMFASVHLEGMNADSPRPFIGSLIIQIIGAFFAAWLLVRAKAMTYMKQVGFVTMIGLFAGIVSALPAWNWMCFSTSWTIVALLDLVIGWFLGGLAIAKLVKK